jgi:hypothetical protein
MIDYAQPMLQAEKHLRAAYEALIRRDFDLGKEELLNAITQTRLAYHAAEHQRTLQDPHKEQ